MHRRLVTAAVIAAILLVVPQSFVLSAGTLAGTVIPVSCKMTYLAGSTSSMASASVSSAVALTAGVTVRANAVPLSVVPGQSYYTLLTTTNKGNASDTISLTGSSAHGWGVSFVRDDNGDGIHQAAEATTIANTGALIPDACSNCFVCVAVPNSATASDTVTVTGTSGSVPSAFASATLGFPAPGAHVVTFTQRPTLSATVVASGGTTNCTAVAADSLGHAVTYKWSDGGAGGTFAPSASVQNPVYTTGANSTGKDIAVIVTCAVVCAQNSTVAMSASAGLTVHSTAPPPVVVSVPGDFDHDGIVGSLDIALFNKEWLRWHQSTRPAFSSAVDSVYDLAPRGSGVWPNWAPIGDKVINTQDATAFAECFAKSKSATLTYSNSVQIIRTSTLMVVTVLSAPYGIYQVNVMLPSGIYFRPTLDANGNLSRVTKGSRAGSIFYDEYDAVARTIKITGNVTGSAPYSVASIYIGY